jgi:hypothetical protein
VKYIIFGVLLTLLASCFVILQPGTIIFDNKSHDTLYLHTGNSPSNPLRKIWAGAATKTKINIPFRQLTYLTIFKQPKPKDLPKALTAVKVINNLSVSPFGKVYILYFNPKHTNVIPQ